MRRTIGISTNGLHLSKKDGLLCISESGETRGKISFDDIGVLIVESSQTSITSSAISAILENTGVVVFCDEGHLPAGILLPHSGHSQMAERLRAQIKATGPLNKNLWKQIVVSKINCQATLLPASAERNRLLSLAKRVRSGDPENLEAQAARFYWPALMGGHFRRDQTADDINSLLNYGYIVIRSAVARAIVATGLNAAIGLHHCSKYNSHSLADDLMEPYRIWIDARVKAKASQFKDGLTPKNKPLLLEVLTDKATINGEEKPLISAIEDAAQSLSKIYLQAADSTSSPSAPKLAAQLALPKEFHWNK